jgi:hypothetical protein
VSSIADPWLQLTEQLEDDLVALGYDPKVLPPTLWLEARMVFAMAIATKEDDGTFRGVYVAVTSLPMYARTLLSGVPPSRIEQYQVGTKEAKRRVTMRRRKYLDKFVHDCGLKKIEEPPTDEEDR